MFQEFRAWLRGTRWIRKNLRGYAPTSDTLRQQEITVKIKDEHAMNLKRNEVVSGNFIYYIIEEGTNTRHTSGGVPVIYSDVDIADYDCNWTHEAVISVAAYNRIFEGIEDGE